MKFLPITALVATSFFGQQVIAADCRLMVRTILENNERGLPGVNLTLRALRNGPALASNFSDTDGLAEFPDLDKGATYYIDAVFPASPQTQSEVVCGQTDSAIEIRIVECVDVSLVQLIANPELWDGRYIRVMGFLNLEFEGNRLYLHRDDWKYALNRNGIGVLSSVEMNNKWKSLNRKHVLIEGVFRDFGATTRVEDIFRCQPWRRQR